MSVLKLLRLYSLVLESERLYEYSDMFVCLFVCVRVCFWRDSPLLLVGQGLHIHELSRSHTTTHQSVRLLWTSDQLVAETST